MSITKSFHVSPMSSCFKLLSYRLFIDALAWAFKITYLESDPASMERVKGDALLWGDKVGLQSRGVLTKNRNE